LLNMICRAEMGGKCRVDVHIFYHSLTQQNAETKSPRNAEGLGGEIGVLGFDLFPVHQACR